MRRCGPIAPSTESRGVPPRSAPEASEPSPVSRTVGASRPGGRTAGRQPRRQCRDVGDQACSRRRATIAAPDGSGDGVHGSGSGTSVSRSTSSSTVSSSTPADAVHHAVMDLGHQCPAPAGEALDEPRLPQGPVAVEAAATSAAP